MYMKTNIILILAVFLTAMPISCKYEQPPEPTPEGDVYYIIGYKIDIASEFYGGGRLVDTANGKGKAGVYLLVPEYFKDTLYDVLFTKYIPGEPFSAYDEVLHNLVLHRALCSGNLPDTLFDFPSSIVYPFDINRNTGVNIFPEAYRWKYKVRMTYRPPTADELYRYFVITFKTPQYQPMVHYPFFYFVPFSKEQEQFIFTTSITRSN